MHCKWLSFSPLHGSQAPVDVVAGSRGRVMDYGTEGFFTIPRTYTVFTSWWLVLLLLLHGDARSLNFLVSGTFSVLPPYAEREKKTS